MKKKCQYFFNFIEFAVLMEYIVILGLLIKLREVLIVFLMKKKCQYFFNFIEHVILKE